MWWTAWVARSTCTISASARPSSSSPSGNRAAARDSSAIPTASRWTAAWASCTWPTGATTGCRCGRIRASQPGPDLLSPWPVREGCKMKRGFILGTLLLGGLLALLASGGATTAYATGGPHGEYTASTDNCAGCHRSHTALGTKLLKDAAAATGQRALNLCKFCHNGSGSALDVMDGVRIDLTGNGGYTVPTADSATQLTVTVESATVVGPTAKSLTTVPANSTTYTIKVKNKSGAAITGTIARSQTNVTATQFATSTLTPAARAVKVASGVSVRS